MSIFPASTEFRHIRCVTNAALAHETSAGFVLVDCKMLRDVMNDVKIARITGRASDRRELSAVDLVPDGQRHLAPASPD